MVEGNLNLARKWRSKHFDELVGQKLVVRTIKNSLYRNLLFPVYLFSGTKGCGKTSMARLFAAALNCKELDTFRKNPQNILLPCLECFSCVAIQKAQHPDFIEIDAASHTGVDNIRQIIDASSFVPALGVKKIYLIDEAHMLSKAAFNALLKVLEEPPHTALFILATTDPHKIIETVRSRCFQLFFHPLELIDLVQHLSFICQQEKISYEQSGLELIAHIAEGSARDALNMIERVRLVYPTITKTSVLETVGSLSEDQLVKVLAAIISGDSLVVLEVIYKLQLERYNIGQLWRNFVDIIRASLWLKHGLNHNIPQGLKQLLMPYVEHCSVDLLIKMIEICYSYEMALAKTTAPHTIFEVILLKLCALHGKKEIPINQPLPKEQKIEQTKVSSWECFLLDIEKLDDPLIMSIFKQSLSSRYDDEAKTLEITFSQDLLFFEEWLSNTKMLWQPIFERYYPNATLNAIFTGNKLSNVPKQIIAKESPQHISKQSIKTSTYQAYTTTKSYKEKEITLTLSEIEKMPQAATLVKIFPGTITYKVTKD